MEMARETLKKVGYLKGINKITQCEDKTPLFAVNHFKILEELGVNVDIVFCVFFADLINACNGKIRR